jgi:hypothetical protein
MRSEFKKHPSYGRIVLTKTHAGGRGKDAGGAVLFGSKVRHPSFISVEIERAELSEDGFGEYVHGTGVPVVRFSMSEAQWAHMISSFGDGGGTPITITGLEDVGFIERPPEQVPVIELANKTAEKVKGDLVARMHDLKRDAAELAAKGAGKKALQQLAHDMEILAEWTNSNFDYLENQVKERMEKEVAKANLEIEALINNAVTRLGERALGERLAAGDKSVLPELLRGEGNE